MEATPDQLSARRRRRAVALCIALACGWLAGLFTAHAAHAADAGDRHVLMATLNGEIDPITDAYISRALDQAQRDGDVALIIAMDTPGGLDTSMRSIIKNMLAAPLPVIICVSPSGARAASAGLYITEAADVAVMAPGTNIGSAHPVTIGGPNPAPQASPDASTQDIESQKIENDAAAYIRALAVLHGRNADWAEKAVRQSVNVPADDAVRLHVVDFEVGSLQTLLVRLDGRSISKQGHSYVLHTAGASVDRIDLSSFDSLLQAVADPTIAYLLLLLAIVGIAIWISHPGLFLPGVAGVVAAVLAFTAFANLPINLAGVLLIVLGLALFVIDIKATTHGVLTFGGVVAMGLGGMLLIDTGALDDGVNRGVIVGTALVLGAIFAFVVRKIVAARRRPVATGQDGLLGRQGIVREPLSPDGLVFVDGALWRAHADAGPLDRGAAVRVVRVDGLTLTVESLDTADARRASWSPH